MTQTLKDKSIAYAEYHGLDSDRCCVVIGEQERTMMVLSTRPGATRWETADKRDFERDAGVYPNQSLAESRLTESQSIYGDCDKQILNPRVVQILDL